MARQMMAAQRAPELVLVLDGIDAVFDWREAVKCEWDTDGHNGGCKFFLCPGDNSAPVGRERNHRGTPYTQNKRSLISVKHCRCQLGNDLRRQSEVILRKEFFLPEKLGGTWLNCLVLFMESNNGLS